MSLLFWQIITLIFALISAFSVVILIKSKKALGATHHGQPQSESDKLNFATSNPNPVMAISKEGTCIFANHGSEPLLTHWNIKINEKIPDEWVNVVKQITISNRPQMVEMSCDDMVYLFSVVPMTHGDARLYGMDVTSFKSLEKALEERATSDEQTNLPNRVVFKQELNKQIESSKQNQQTLGVIMARFDDFGQIIYTYGQEIAYDVLIDFAKRLSHFASDDCLVARLTDSEFGLIVPNIGQTKDVVTYLESLLELCNQPYESQGQKIFIQITAGVTLCPNDGDTADVLTRNANLAVNRTNGARNPFEFFQIGMEEQITHKREIIEDLRIAIDESQFELYYQPQIDLKNKKLIGCEALIRWNHPTKGFISPFHFIPAAEETNLIGPIGDWVLNEACKQIATWQNKGFANIKVWVNLVAEQVLNINLVEQIRTLMRHHEITAESLGLELTESALVDDKDTAITVMNKLKESGLDLAIDDFGTGYSSLSYLVQFPINKLKIDRSFVMEIKDEIEGHAVTKGIIDLGHSMNMNIVAEGVETKEQLIYLDNCRCDIVQGYIFGKPVSAKEFEDFFETNWADEIEKSKLQD